MNPEFAITLRAKKLGVLLKDARQHAGKTMKESGESVGISGSTIGSFEKGVSSPSLPELEILSHFFNMPIDHFWKDTIISQEEDAASSLDKEAFFKNRNWQIGQKLNEARLDLDITYEEITDKTGVTYGRMKRFETGETPIPLPELELLSNTLKIPMAEFFEQESSIGQWISAQENIDQFLSLPIDIQHFVTKPTNQPYIEVAQKLSQLSADQLRTIAESILEITI